MQGEAVSIDTYTRGCIWARNDEMLPLLQLHRLSDLIHRVSYGGKSQLEV